MSKILIVLSGADSWTRTDGSKYPTGYWAQELVDIHEMLVEAGYGVDLATPEGRKPTADPRSLDPSIAGPEARRFASYLESISESLRAPLTLSGVNVAAYDAMVIPGGHGPMEDLYKDPAMGRLLFAAEDAGKVVGSVCHGPAALLSAIRSDRSWLYAGRAMTGLSDEEEIEFGTAANAPWLLADTLRKRGARYRKGANWAPYIVRDGRLISGQNPASSAAVADAVLAVLRETKAA
jgi:putative intracellular protease/amidase